MLGSKTQQKVEPINSSVEQTADQEKEPKKKGFQRSQSKAGFKNDSEAEPLYQKMEGTDKDRLLSEVAERYNLIMGYIQKYDKDTREFACYLVQRMIPNMSSLDLEELSDLLSYIDAELIKVKDAFKVKVVGNETLLKAQLAKPSIDVMI